MLEQAHLKQAFYKVLNARPVLETASPQLLARLGAADSLGFVWSIPKEKGKGSLRAGICSELPQMCVS